MMLLSHMALSQTNIRFQVLDNDTKEPLIGATAFVSATKGGISDNQGFITLTELSGSEAEVRFSFIGYETQTLTFIFSQLGSQAIQVLMESAVEESEEVIVTATRSSRSIDEIPTRIEFLGTEELEEKAIMKSANIAMLLRESTGIQMQITSPSSANQSIRIQGLDGRYTQLLKDGFPLYGGFSGGLSIMQIPPLDLQQVEVIKGSNATLYGGGAIAGLVNLVSIQPEEEARIRLMLD